MGFFMMRMPLSGLGGHGASVVAPERDEEADEPVRVGRVGRLVG